MQRQCAFQRATRLTSSSVYVKRFLPSSAQSSRDSRVIGRLDSAILKFHATIDIKDRTP